MASTLQFILFSILLLSISISISNAKKSFRPNALVLPVYKDASTLQYVTRVYQRTPLVSIKVVFDLGGQHLWVDCEQDYVSLTYVPVQCGSAQCTLAGATGCGDCYSTARPGCNNNTCGVLPDNTVTRTATGGELAKDVLALQSTNGKNPGKVVSVRHFIFVCAPHFLLTGLADGVKGMAGFGRTNISLPWQLADVFNFHKKFAICLSSSTNSSGVVFIGNGPYVMLGHRHHVSSLMYTPLFINPVSTASAYSQGEPSAEYFIGVTSIKINEEVVSLNTSLLNITSDDGLGGTKISTVNPYTVLETSIYDAVTTAFIKAANLTTVASVAPFSVCFSSEDISSTIVGPAVPTIDLVLQSESVFWRIYGANSMVKVSDDVMCLGFVDGGSNPRTSIVIGGYQLEDNLLQFDLVTSILGFSSSLLSRLRPTTCSNFNFTSTA